MNLIFCLAYVLTRPVIEVAQPRYLELEGAFDFLARIKTADS
jgi:hypothetical protein